MGAEKMAYHNTKPELFLLSDEIINSLTNEEMNATLDDMEELGIAKLPYYNFAIQISTAAWQHVVYEVTNVHTYKIVKNDDMWLRFGYMLETLDVNQSIVGKFHCMTSGGHDMFDLLEHDSHLNARSSRILGETVSYTAGHLLQVLTVVFATKNVVKTTVVNKLAKLGIGLKKNPYIKITTLTIGKVVEKADGKGGHDGSHRRPHLRRGHKREQRYGPNWQFTRTIFIEPIFVNADEGWIAERTAYNVGKSHR
jgi:predicted protein tyrosine phosphatase